MQVTLLQRNKLIEDDVFEQEDFFTDFLYRGVEQQSIKNIVKYSGLLKKFRSMMVVKQKRYLEENKSSLRKANALEGFSQQIPIATQQCFSLFSQSLMSAKNLRFLQIAGFDLHPLLAIELSQGIQANSSLRELNLSGCRMNSFSLQYLFTSLSNHKSLQSLNLFNNQGFTSELMTDMREFLFLGSVPLKNLKLTHCNIDPLSLSFLFRNLKYSKTITSIDVSMMQCNLAALTSLSIGLQHFSSFCGCCSGRVLETLNIGDMNIKNNGMETLAQTIDQFFYKLNIKEIILRRNKITQDGVVHLEKWLSNINGLRRLDLSENQINEFNSSSLLQMSLYELKLSKNEIKTFPLCFFTNVLILNLSQNKINNLGAFQLASVLSTNPAWIELNLSDNNFKTEGFNSLIFGLRDNKKLKKLTVAHCELDGEALICLMINHEQLQIEYLDISYNQIRYSLLFVLINYLRGGKIRCLRAACTFNDLNHQQSTEELTIESSPLHRRTSYGLSTTNEDEIGASTQEQKIAKYAVFQIASFHLRELDFHGNQGIFQPVISSLATYYNKIECLDLSSTKIRSNQEILDLANFLQKTTSLHDFSLRDVDLGRLEPNAFKVFARGLGQNQSIIRLNLSKNKLGRSYVILKDHKQDKIKKKVGYYFKTLVKQGLKSYNLEYLDLSQNLLDNDLAILFERMIIQLKNLSELNLSKNFLGSFTISGIINGVKQNKRLKSLNLSNLNLRSDDLILIGQLVNQAESLQSLNISNNMGFSNVGTLYSKCSQKKQKYLCFQDVEVDQSSFANLSQSIKYQSKYVINNIKLFRNLRGISLEGCRFQMNKFEYLLDQLNNVSRLETLQLSQIHTIKMDIQKVSIFRNLLTLQVNQTILCDEFIFKLSHWLSRVNCRILFLDLSYNFLRQNWIDVLFEGIEKNSSIKNLKLRRCFLGQYDLSQLEIGLYKSNIQSLDISQNELVSLSYFWSSSLKNIKLSGNKITDMSELFFMKQLTDSQQINTNLMKLLSLDFSSCQLDIHCFKKLLYFVQSQVNFCGFQFLKCVILTDNKLQDENGQIIKELILKSEQLEELILNKNQFTSVGMFEIFQGVLEQQNVRWLDISNNKLDDKFIQLISKQLQSYLIRSLEFLQLYGNQFSKRGIKELISIMRVQINLFVDNNWQFLSDDEGLIVLAQYKRISQIYQTGGDLQYFMKKITMTQCQLTDEFCKTLSDTFMHLSFIEQIDLSENPLITMYGKVYMFVQFFDPKNERHRLQTFYISDSVSNGNLFDDGLLRYTLCKVRNFFQRTITPIYIPQRKSQSMLSSQVRGLGGQTIVTHFLGGRIGACIIHKINHVFAWLDRISPPQFMVSTLFIGQFRSNLLKIRIYNLLSFIITIIINGLGIIFFIDDHIKVVQDKVNLFMQNDCTNNFTQVCKHILPFEVPHGNYILSFWLLIVAISIFELFVTIQIRRNIKPAFQIISPKLIEYLQSKLPHKSEILKLIISIVFKIHLVTDWFVIWVVYLFSSIKYDQNTEIELQQDSLKLYKSSQIFIAIRILLNLIMNLINFYQFLRIDPNYQQAEFLTMQWKKSYFENYYTVSSLMGQICPIGGFQINKKIKMNYLVAVELFDFFVNGVPMLILSTFIVQFYLRLVNEKFCGLEMIQNFPNYLFTIWTKELLRALISLYIIMTTRPSVIKQYQFNQALTIKKFYKNKQNFIKQSDFDTQMSDNYFEEFQKNMHEWLRKQPQKKIQSKSVIQTINEIDQEDEEDLSRYEGNQKMEHSEDSGFLEQSPEVDDEFDYDVSVSEQENFVNQMPNSKIAPNSMRRNYNV